MSIIRSIKTHQTEITSLAKNKSNPAHSFPATAPDTSSHPQAHSKHAHDRQLQTWLDPHTGKLNKKHSYHCAINHLPRCTILTLLHHNTKKGSDAGGGPLMTATPIPHVRTPSHSHHLINMSKNHLNHAHLRLTLACKFHTIFRLPWLQPCSLTP